MAERLIDVAQRSSNADEFEQGMLEVFQRTVGFDAAFFLVNGARSAPACSGLDPATAARVLARSRAYEPELLPVKRAAFARRGVAVDTEVLGWDRVERSQYFREIATTVGGRHSLLAYVPFQGRVRAVLMLGRSHSSFAAREIERVEAALPELGVARAGFGWPVSFEPLTRPATDPLWKRLGDRLASESRASVTTQWGQLVVRDREGYREMVARSGGSDLVWTRAGLADPSESGWPYVDLFHLAAALAPERRRALFVGSGGAVALRQFARVYPGIAIDLVEHDARVIDLARTHFDLDAIPSLSVHVADGLDFAVRADPQTWDVAIVDAYDESTAPTLGGARFFRALARALRTGGTAAINVLGSLNGRGALQSVLGSLRPAFDKLRVLPVVNAGVGIDPDALRNVVVVATRAG